MKTSFQIFKDFFSFVGWLAPAYGIDEINSNVIPKGIDEINSNGIPKGFVIDEVNSNIIPKGFVIDEVNSNGILRNR